jgi:hypothetical protein
MPAKKLYTEEELKLRKKISQQNRIKNETPEQKKLRHDKQVQWNKNNPDKIATYRNKSKKSVLENSKKWQKENRERAYEISKKWRERNRDIINEKARASREINKEEKLNNRRLKNKIRRETDPVYKFSENIRALISESFKRGKNNFSKTLKSETILGCTIEHFVKYILDLCPKGVTLKDFGRYGYHIDHIIPVSSAKTEEDVIRLNHYSNLRPLWWRDNIQKSNKTILKN